MRYRKEGSLTIEAALIFPLVLGVFVMAICGGTELYKDVKDTAVIIETEADPDTVSLFYISKGLEGVINSGD